MKTARLLLIAVLLTVPLSLVAFDPPLTSSNATEVLSFPLSNGSSIDLHVTPEMRSHSYTRYALYFASNALALLVLALFLYTRFGAWVRARVETHTRKPFVVALLTAAGLIITGSLLTLPLAIYSGYVVPHQYGLSTQWLSGWLGEWLIGLVTEVVILSPLVALGLFAIRAFPRWWWIVIWAGSIPISILLVVIAPVVLDPLYNDFRPLRDAKLRAELLQLADRAGIEGGRVYEVDKSKQTTTMNAYVTGLGPTKRIVLWDTLLQKMSRDEILVVMAHEMAHYTRQHIWKGLAFGYAVMFPCMVLGAWIIAAGVRRWGRRWGVEAPHDPAALPWILGVMTAGMILLTPVLAAYSRTIEHESDVIALQLTGMREEAATAFVKFSEDSKSLPQPPKLIEYWYYTHPPLAKRIAFVLGTEPVRKTLSAQ
ncbi:MAG: M48 family metallopeptidase [Thermoanaerobaculia bacterium]